MTEEQTITSPNENKKAQTLLIGGVLGAVTGVGVAYMLLKQSEQRGVELEMGTGQGVRLGLLLLGLLRQVAQLPESE